MIRILSPLTLITIITTSLLLFTVIVGAQEKDPELAMTRIQLIELVTHIWDRISDPSHQIEKDFVQIEKNQALAKLYHEADQVQKVDELLKDCLTIAHNIRQDQFPEPKDRGQEQVDAKLIKINSLIMIAKTMQECHRSAEARNLLLEIQKLLTDHDQATARDSIKYYRKLAEVFHDLGEEELALHVAEKALSLARKGTNSYEIFHNLFHVVCIYTDLNRKLEARHVLSEVVAVKEDRSKDEIDLISLMEKIKSKSMKLEQDITEVMKDADILSEALVEKFGFNIELNMIYTLLDQARVKAEKIGGVYDHFEVIDQMRQRSDHFTPQDKAKRLVGFTEMMLRNSRYFASINFHETMHIARLAVDAEDYIRAKKYINEALSLRNSIDREDRNIRVLTEASILYSKMGENGYARNLLNDAMKMNEAVSETSSKQYSDDILARASYQLGDEEVTSKILDRMLLSARSTENEQFRSNELSQVAHSYALYGKLNKAIHIIKDIEGPYKKSGYLQSITRIALKEEAASAYPELIREALLTAQANPDLRTQVNCLIVVLELLGKCESVQANGLQELIKQTISTLDVS